MMSFSFCVFVHFVKKEPQGFKPSNLQPPALKASMLPQDKRGHSNIIELNYILWLVSQICSVLVV